LGLPEVAKNTLRAGITPFDSSSDHRGLFVDVDLTTILGGSATTIPAAQYRDLHSSDPKAVEKYRCALIKYFDEHRVEERAAALHFKLLTTQECSDENSLQMNAADRETSLERGQQLLRNINENTATHGRRYSKSYNRRSPTGSRG
jgi:hypothetical protein